ncbi:hypothetical protein ARMGADRAFT_1082284 [Armillaria gallica]|uniref:CCHC-type domain-containing protein n=1 Tax=Armillaria gallica TaxID=47427 RepID=A0A2H3D733_ARMGA|nr:hypothetical protein ARMGADRAFT_1082284 [Armillaria gallica]
MSSHSSHPRSTSTHPYPYQIEEPRQSTSTLASSVAPQKKTFLGRWKSTFKKEAMEALPEQGTLLSSFLTTTHRTAKDPPAIPPILHDPLLPLTQQTWQGTSYDLAWASAAQPECQFQTNLPESVLGIHQPTPHSGLTSFGTISTFQPVPSSQEGVTPTNPDHPTQNTPPLPTETSPYKSPSILQRPHAESRLSMSSAQRALHRPDSHPPGHQGGTTADESPTSQRQTSGGTPLPEQLSASETRMQRRQSGTRSFEEGSSPLPSVSREEIPPDISSMETRGEATPPPRQTTLLTLGRALYLLSTGKLTTVPEILFRASTIDLFNHFARKLVEDPDWASTPAGIDYTHYGYSYILKEEARHFACVTWNMIHLEQTIKVLPRYQRPSPDISSVATTPEPGEDIRMAPPVHPVYAQSYPIPSYIYPCGYGPPDARGYARPFAGAGTDQPVPPQLPQPPVPPQQPNQPPAGPPPPPPPGPPGPLPGPRRWAPPRYPPPPPPPDPPAPWNLDPNNQGLWANLKPNMVKEPDNFNGDSNDIARFFSQCDMYFSIFNQYFRYHPHKVIFAASRFGKDAQVWWELCARELGRDTYGEQLYPDYDQFVAEVRRRFWKDVNAEIKLAQWEELRQKTFTDGDLFFQQFESLAFKAGVFGIDQMMVAQVKKACRSTTKDIIYGTDGDLPTNYQEWKRRILRIDYNWRTRKAEMGRVKVVDWKQQVKTNIPKMTQQQQHQTSVPERKTGTGTTYGGAGAPMDIGRAQTKAKCFRCGEIGHFKCDCPKGLKTKEEALRRFNFYWDHVATQEKTDSKIEEVKDSAEQ